MRVLVASEISHDALGGLRSEHDVIYMPGSCEDELALSNVDRECLVFRSGVQITEGVLAAAPDLRLIVRAGSGYDNIDLGHLSNRRIRVVRIPGPGAKAVAELSFALMLALARQLFWADRHWRSGHWVKSEIAGRLLTGRVLGVVGAGNIGTRTGELGAAWGMSVLGCVRRPSSAVADRLSASGITLASLDEVLTRADFVSVHVPLDDSTRNLLNAETLRLMKRGSYLVNLSRGGVVDEDALRRILESGHLAGAALDVHEREGEGQVSDLAGLESVILTPHIGASTIDTQNEIGESILRSIARYEHEPVQLLATPENFIVM